MRGLGVSESLIAESSGLVVACNDPKNRAMSDTYHVLNSDLLRLVQTEPLPISHITGEARVLVDPAHRNVIAADKKWGEVVRLACRQPDSTNMRIVDAETFLGVQRPQWQQLSWDDVVDILTLCATGAVRIFVLKKPAPIHFSVYGRDRVLLQEEHVHPSDGKRVWYLKSPDLVDELKPKAEKLLSDAFVIPISSFDSLLQWLFSPGIWEIVSADTIPEKVQNRWSEGDRLRLLRMGWIDSDQGGEITTGLTDSLRSLEPAE
jgi:hypothetical protein